MRYSVFTPAATGGKFRKALTLATAIVECRTFEEVWITPEETDRVGEIVAAVEECQLARRFWWVVRLW